KIAGDLVGVAVDDTLEQPGLLGLRHARELATDVRVELLVGLGLLVAGVGLAQPLLLPPQGLVDDLGQRSSAGLPRAGADPLDDPAGDLADDLRDLVRGEHDRARINYELAKVR